MIRAAAFVVLALGGIPAVNAGDVILVIEPSHAFPGQPVRLRIDSTSGCQRTTYSLQSTDLATRTITVYGSSPDSGPETCPPEHVTPRTLELGSFGAGSYSLNITSCGFIPPGVEQCSVVRTLVFEVGDATPVPATGATAAIVLAGLLFGVAFSAGAFAVDRRGSELRRTATSAVVD